MATRYGQVVAKRSPRAVLASESPYSVWDRALFTLRWTLPLPMAIVPIFPSWGASRKVDDEERMSRRSRWFLQLAVLEVLVLNGCSPRTDINVDARQSNLSARERRPQTIDYCQYVDEKIAGNLEGLECQFYVEVYSVKNSIYCRLHTAKYALTYLTDLHLDERYLANSSSYRLREISDCVGDITYSTLPSECQAFTGPILDVLARRYRTSSGAVLRAAYRGLPVQRTGPIQIE